MRAIEKIKGGAYHVQSSLVQIDSTTWLIGNSVLTRHSFKVHTATWNDEVDGSCYVISAAPNPRPNATVVKSPYIKLLRDSDDLTAIWSIGNSALCKVRYTDDDVTPESRILGFVRRQDPHFYYPKVYHDEIHQDRSILFMSRVVGSTLDVVWPTLNEQWKRHYATLIVMKCTEMTSWTVKDARIGGVDGQLVVDDMLAVKSGGDLRHIPSACEEIDMNCRDLCFSHNDLNPKHIIVENNPVHGKVGIIGFRTSGFLPRHWVLTKFKVSPSMSLSNPGSDDSKRWTRDIQNQLAMRGFESYALDYGTWARAQAA